MINGRTVVRRVAKRTYDKYTIMDQEPLVDNLNPVKPTELESQLEEVKDAVREKVLSAYSKVDVEIPEDLFDKNVSPGSLLNDINNLINRVKGKGALEDWGNNIGGSPANIYPIISAPEEASALDNPFVLDCEGIDTSGLTGDGNSGDENTDSGNGDSEDSDGSGSGDASGSDGSSGNGSNAGDGKEVKIVYKNLCTGEDISEWPDSLLSNEFPYNFMTYIPEKYPENQVFEGWYLDADFQTKVFSKNYEGENTITVYANFVDEGDANSNNYEQQKPVETSMVEKDSQCDLVELSWLKVILIIVMVANILIQVFVMIYNISKALADIMKDAQLCWINPPSLQSLISYVMQRLSAVLFQIVGMMLMKLWAMLDLDCVSDNVTRTMGEINDAMGSISNLLNEINALALGMGKGNGFSDLLKSLFDSIEGLKDQFKDQKDKLVEEIKKIPETLGKTASDQKKIWTNPSTYLAMVPPEISSKINGMLNQVNNTKSSIKNLQTSINKSIALFQGESEEDSVDNSTSNVDKKVI